MVRKKRLRFFSDSGMKRLLFGAIILFTSTTGSAQWISLFNGKNLDGWKQLNGKAHYEVVNGEIAGTSVANTTNSFLATEAEYTDFVLELEFKIDDQSNSGIQVRSESTPEYQNGRVHGYQIEIDPTPRSWTGGIYDEGRRDWLYPLEYNPSAKTAFKHGVWNMAHIECIGPVIRTWINGVATSQVVDNLTPRGFIALQVHSPGKPEEAGKHVYFKNIRIQTKDIKLSPLDTIFVVNLLPNSLSDQEKVNGLNLLWDGKTTIGWRGANLAQFPATGWSVSNEVLQVLAPDNTHTPHGGDIISTREFGAFDLQFEFKFEEGANSGVKYFVVEKSDHSAPVLGLEYQILDDQHHPDAKLGVVGNRTLASLYDLIPSLKIPRGTHNTGEWNQGRIIVYPDQHIEHWLNGYKVVEYQRGSPVYRALVARSKYASYENFGMADKGHILLQDHGSNVAFRSIKIKELK